MLKRIKTFLAYIHIFVTDADIPANIFFKTGSIYSRTATGFG
jgi:hypothetical protein